MQPLDALLLVAPFAVLIALDRWALGRESPGLRRMAWIQWLVLVGSTVGATFAIGLAIDRAEHAAMIASGFGLLVASWQFGRWHEWRVFRRVLDAVLASGGESDLTPLLADVDRARGERGRWDELARVRVASEELVRARRLDDAETLLAHAARRRLPPEWAYMIVHHRAMIALAARDLSRAEALRSSVARPAPKRAWEDHLQLVDAWADLLADAPEKVLERARDRCERGPGAVHWLATRAHAEAARGDHDAALATLRDLRSRRDPALDLASVARSELPAAKLAAELLRGEPHPFR